MEAVSVGLLQENRTNKMCVCVHMGMLYFKELVHGIVGLARPKSVRQAHR